jgi:hypothetical protein
VLVEHLGGDGAADSGDSPERRIRPAGNTHEEFLNALAAVKRDVDEVVANYPMKLPTTKAAESLARELRTLYDSIKVYQNKEPPSIRKDLSTLRNYALEASAAAKRLRNDESIARMTDAFKHMEKFQGKLQAVFNFYNSRNR